jgi:hypothetical protein
MIYIKMNFIIKSIQDTINSPELKNAPIMIYMGVGTYAGLISEIDGEKILEDKNYHQFPPCVRKLFSDNKDMHLFIILIDPMQENPIYMSTDENLKKEYFQSDWIYIEESDNICETYINDRMTVYPFRKSVKIQINNFNHPDNIDITENLEQLNKICIDNDITFLYHDFTGQDTSKNLEGYFIEQIKNNLEHIIYGIGGGYINGCYFDFTSRDTFFAPIIEYESRKIIKTFSITKILNDFNDLNILNKISFYDYLTYQINKYNIEDIEVIYSQISNLKEDFRFKFKNYIIHLLRVLYDFEIKKEKPMIDIDYYLNKFDKNNFIKNMITNNDPQIFEKSIYHIANIYKNEIKFIVNNRYSELNEVELLQLITKNPDKYKWMESFNQFFI